MTDNSAQPAQSRADATRARLLDAAIQSFASKGFHATTTRDIAATAGMSPAALYVHHKSKEELLYLIALAGHTMTLQLVREGIAASSDPVEQLRRVVHGYVAYHAQHHTSARVVNYEIAALNAEHLATVRTMRQQIDRELSLLVDRGVAAGLFHTTDPRMAAIALQSLAVDIARWYREDGAWSPEHIADRYTDIALRVVGAGTTTPLQ